MDKLIYTAMAGAKYLLARQDTAAQNLAQASTQGYRAQIDAFRSTPVNGDGAATRVFAVDTTVGTDFTPGPVQPTGRDLDIAVSGKGWLAVQGNDGTEGYTRFGSLRVSAEGVLETMTGLPVLGDGGGPINAPVDARISIAPDGTVSAIPASGAQTAVNVVGRIKLVNPEENTLVRGGDGLFRTRDGDAPADPAVRVNVGALEGSNVNPVEAMVSMIAVARQFEIQMKMLSNADDNARQATKLLSNG
jgi:flagellar basal-body rod protein FlgF